tara:strand:- start:480 stop:1619 length:1140 start_codon:yes stop_codon:yes gene_type:complete
VIPIGLYIHIPWCEKKCPYCDFNSHEIKRNKFTHKNNKEYLNALFDDIDYEVVQQNSKVKINSIFIGGGTPSLMPPQFYFELFEKLRRSFDFTQDVEVTLEANPGAVDINHFKGFKQVGINRLSIGCQSFSDAQLNSLGRVHKSCDIYTAYEAARKSGFENINLDLMHGLPDQSVEQGITDLRKAIALSPEHISWYQLTIEQNTIFHKTPPILPEENILINLFERGDLLLKEQGYNQYEVSAYSRENNICAHNLNYWQFGDYIGIGAGAHGKITQVNGEVIRKWKTRMPEDYITKKNKLSGHQIIKTDNLPSEFMMNALRLNQGFTEYLYENRTGLKFINIKKIINSLILKGLIQKNKSFYNTTSKGKLFLDDVLVNFL